MRLGSMIEELESCKIGVTSKAMAGTLWIECALLIFVNVDRACLILYPSHHFKESK